VETTAGITTEEIIVVHQHYLTLVPQIHRYNQDIQELLKILIIGPIVRD